MEQYKILKVENSNLKEIPYIKLKTQIRREIMREIHDNLNEIESIITRLTGKYFDGPVSSKNFNISKECRNLMLSKSKFTRADITKKIRKLDDGTYINLIFEDREEIEYEQQN